MKKTKQHKVHVTLTLPRVVQALLALAKAVAAAFAANPKLFTAPVPSLLVFNSDIAALDAAETATQTRAPGSVEARDAKRTVVEEDLRKLRAYVQQVADADEANAAMIAKEAGMGVAKVRSSGKQNLTAKPSKKGSGAVDVVAKAPAGRASHEWEVSTDGGKTFTAAPSTLQAKTTLIGLTPGQIVLVRHRAVTKAGSGDWSQTVSVVVA